MGSPDFVKRLAYFWGASSRERGVKTTIRTFNGIEGVELQNLSLQCSLDCTAEIMNAGDEIMKHLIQRIHIKNVNSAEPLEFIYEKPSLSSIWSL